MLCNVFVVVFVVIIVCLLFCLLLLTYLVLLCFFALCVCVEYVTSIIASKY